MSANYEVKTTAFHYTISQYISSQHTAVGTLQIYSAVAFVVLVVRGNVPSVGIIILYIIVIC